MTQHIEGIDPVAIALEEVDIADCVRLIGVDLDTGGRTTVTIERRAFDESAATSKALFARGLVLTLAIQKLDFQA